MTARLADPDPRKTFVDPPRLRHTPTDGTPAGQLRQAVMTGRAGLLAVPFACVRLPVAVLDNHLVRRWSKYARGRIMFDYAVGVADGWAGNILQEDHICATGHKRCAGARRRWRANQAQLSDSPMASGRHYATTRPARP